MKTVGIIGGFGPETTARFYLDIIEKGLRKYDKIRVPVLISNVSVPIEFERDAILKNYGIERNIPFLVSEAKRLEKAGADFLVFPCNSLHIFIDDIRAAVKIPVLSIIDEAVKYILKQEIKNLGIISTAITVKNRLYENRFADNSIDCSVPTFDEQKILDSIIVNLIVGKKDEVYQIHLNNILHNFKKRNITNIILACTDLQLLDPECKGVKLYDSMNILADATVEYIFK